MTMNVDDDDDDNSSLSQNLSQAKRGCKAQIWADTAQLLQPGGNASNRSKLHFNVEKKSPVSIQLVKQR